MKIGNIITAVLLLFLGVLTVLTNQLMDWLVQYPNLPWFTAYLIPRIIYAVSLILLASICVSLLSLQTSAKALVFILIIVVGSFLLVNKPYGDKLGILM